MATKFAPRWANVLVILSSFVNLIFTIGFGVYLYQNKQKEVKLIDWPMIIFVGISALFNFIALIWAHEITLQIFAAFFGFIINVIILLFYLQWKYGMSYININIQYINVAYIVSIVFIIFPLNIYSILKK